MPEEVKPDVIIEDDTKPEETVVIPQKEEEKPVSESDKIAEKVREDFDKLYGSRIEALESRLRQSLRQNDQLRTDISKQVAQPKPAPVPTPAQQKDELDALVEQGNWKEAVSKLAAVEAKQLFEQQRQLEQQQVELQNRQVRFEQAKQVIIQRFPDLDPETGNEESPLSKEFNQVLNENQWLLREPLGPIEAIRLTEDRLRAQGVDPTKFYAQQAAPVGDNKEVVRRQRANLSGLPASRPGKPGTITLTKSEKEFIDFNGIDVNTYVRNKQLVEQGGGIEA